MKRPYETNLCIQYSSRAAKNFFIKYGEIGSIHGRVEHVSGDQTAAHVTCYLLVFLPHAAAGSEQAEAPSDVGA